MTMRFISIDVATKTLAVSVIDYIIGTLDIRDKNSFSNLKVIKTFTVNLAPDIHNAKIGEVDRVSLIINFFNNHLVEYCNKDTIMLLEKQISTTLTYICYISLITLGLNLNLKVETIAATRKNQLCIDDEKIGKYFKQCPNTYTANKLHSKKIVELIRPYLDNTDNININKKMILDWSDTISQLIAYINIKSL